VGDSVEGKITRITPFGAFVQVTPVIEALVHISELSNEHVEDPGKLVKLGETKQFKIIAIDTAAHKLSLSLKEPKAAKAIKGAAAEAESGADKPARKTTKADDSASARQASS
ncbi:MAG TPA: S1 RNA-binding domain-containing protein, partial [Candidatus Saccharimonadales bacterium]|nr:S1 RNA-binding domain-containing protein [Candidatus Saccharimonadales bacterium]